MIIFNVCMPVHEREREMERVGNIASKSKQYLLEMLSGLT